MGGSVEYAGSVTVGITALIKIFIFFSAWWKLAIESAINTGSVLSVLNPGLTFGTFLLYYQLIIQCYGDWNVLPLIFVRVY